jgi:DNA-binding response OmpR family regulator
VLQQIIKAGETDYMSGSEIKVVGEVGWKILVVDDEQIILDLLKRVLNREGYQVSTARFADEAVAEICSQEYDLAITAVGLRYTDALELTERIGTASPQTAIVLMTGNREEEIVRFAEAHAQGRRCESLWNRERKARRKLAWYPRSSQVTERERKHERRTSCARCGR